VHAETAQEAARSTIPITPPEANVQPLNRTKTHPLKPASIAVLRRLAEDGPVRSHMINPGVRNRLSREGLVEEYHGFYGGRAGPFYRITDVGRQSLVSQS